MRKRKKSEDSGFNVWRSYSDMMAGVLLLFILIMCVTLFQAQKSYNESIKERDDKIALQEQYTAEILAQQSELDEKDSKLSSQDEQLDKQKKLLAELAAQLKEQQASLDEKTSLLATQQKKIDNIIGVKADVIEALQKEFSKNNVSVDIDAQTGALTLNANVLFDYDKSELTDEGKQELADILPIYCKVLLQKDYKKYLAEIIIDGYTDTDGDYDYNLELSQKRSLAVAQYLTEIREYFIPKTQDKLDPLTVSEEEFCDVVCRKPCNVSRAVYSSLTGISPVVAEEICFRASIDGSDAAQSLDEAARVHLYHTFRRLMDQVVEGDFSPNIVYRGEEPVEYGVFAFQQYGPEYHSVEFESVSQMLETYYATKNTLTRIHQKSSDLRRIVQTALERNRKKLSLQEKQMKDTAKKEKYKVYGELINTYGYGLEDGCKSFKALNYYTNEEITIPLDPTMTPAENSKKYFDKYGKLKRTEEALTEQIADTRSEIDHLESVSNALDIALAESDLAQIKEELMEYGYIKKHYDRRKGQKAQSKSKPFHYVTEDGYDIYVGKNNFQNDELTFKFATGNDWWFHAKKMAGSHVVVKSKDGELPDHIFEIAGQLAAYYSKGRTAPKVEIDYIQKKQVKKPAGAKPGFVVYYTNYSLMAEPSLKGVREV